MSRMLGSPFRHCGRLECVTFRVVGIKLACPNQREILLPCDVEISCISGRLIEYAVCHRSIVNVAKLKSFVEGPWKTHQALPSTLPRSPGRFLTRPITTSSMKFPAFDRNAAFSSDVAVFQKEAQYAVVSKSSADFKQWCHSSFVKGAAGAHAFLLKPDEPQGGVAEDRLSRIWEHKRKDSGKQGELMEKRTGTEWKGAEKECEERFQ